MPFTLANLKTTPGARTRSRRKGRGAGSGRGTTAGRGTKGQRARTGGRKGLQRLGLKMILQRIPKHRGFTSPHPRPAIVNVGTLQEKFVSQQVVTPLSLQQAGLVRDAKKGVKLLGEGELTKALVVKGCVVSKSAREKIEKAGGQIE